MNKKYFLATFIALMIQALFGINSAIAVPCEAEFNAVIEIFKEASRKNNFTYQGANVPYNFVTDIVFTSPNDFWPNLKKKMSDPYYGVNNNTFAENVDHFRHLNKMARDRAKNGSYEPTILEVCYTQAMVDANGDIDSIINGKTANKSSSSGSSSQSNKKANRQPAENQSSSSSNSSDLSNKSQDQLIDIASIAEKRGDYALAYAAELQLSKDSDREIARQALRRVAYRLREGQGVKQNLSEAQRQLEQAASMGDVPAHSILCDSYINGKGVAENHKKAMEYCLFAAEKGLKGAQSNLAWLYMHGNGIEQNQRLSDEWTCKAAAQGEEASVGNVKKLNLNCN